MKISVRPNSLRSLRRSVMTWPWIETSSADTGSSQMISFGLGDHRAGNADALCLAAGELVRIAVDHLRHEADGGHDLAHTIQPLAPC